jgi:carbonic anhydrase
MSAKKGSPAPKKNVAATPVDFIYRYSPSDPKEFFIPKDWEEAATELRNGNDKIVRFFDACKHGKLETRPPVVELSQTAVELEPKADDGFPQQHPFAALVGCADARVPAEILFGQEFNDIFNIRVAGSVLAPECIGSLLYALKSFVPEGPGKNLRGLKLVVALGHRGCGAVKAAVKAYRNDVTGANLPDDPISKILKHIFSPAVTVGARALDAVFGAGSSLDEHFQLLLVEIAVYLNAAWLGHELRRWVVLHGDEAAAKVGVVYGVFDPGDFRVRARPPDYGNPSHESVFAPPPRDLDELSRMAMDIARGLHHSLGGGPPTFSANRAFFP